MANKKAKQKKPKQMDKASGQKGGSASYEDMGSLQPAKKKRKNK
ncbi:MAG: hypothetical protein ABFD49_06420 [Armatimonadota bacterium]